MIMQSNSEVDNIAISQGNLEVHFSSIIPMLWMNLEKEMDLEVCLHSIVAMSLCGGSGVLSPRMMVLV